MVDVVEIDMREFQVTPVFKLVELENIPKSETAGYAVMERKEVVEVRIAGSRNFSPVFLTDEFWMRDGNRTITYAERWPEQYMQFKNGTSQEALGTPLEMLSRFGVTPEQISLCRVCKIYSIEALSALEGDKLKSLGMHQNKLRDAARQFLAERGDAAGVLSELETLRKEIADLKAAQAMVPPAVDFAPEAIVEIEEAADASVIKDEIALLTGQRPRGNPSVATLQSMLAELKG